MVTPQPKIQNSYNLIPHQNTPTIFQDMFATTMNVFLIVIKLIFGALRMKTVPKEPLAKKVVSHLA